MPSIAIEPTVTLDIRVYCVFPTTPATDAPPLVQSIVKEPLNPHPEINPATEVLPSAPSVITLAPLIAPTNPPIVAEDPAVKTKSNSLLHAKISLLIELETIDPALAIETPAAVVMVVSVSCETLICSNLLSVSFADTPPKWS